jgi:hypothetical protein
MANVLLIATMLVVDSTPLRKRARRMDITLDVVHSDDAALVADLERRLGGRVLRHQVKDVDYVRALAELQTRGGPQVLRARRGLPPAYRELAGELQVLEIDGRRRCARPIKPLPTAA